MQTGDTAGKADPAHASSRTGTTNIVLLGIGGQGTLTMMEALAMAAEAVGEEVRVLSRVSLARLGGSGMCHVRLGPAASPAIPAGEANYLLSLEMSEVLRALPLARPGALAFISMYRRLPIAAGVTGAHYPTRDEVMGALREAGVNALFIPEVLPVSAKREVPASETDSHSRDTGGAHDMENSRINIVMLGVLTGYTHLLPRSSLEQAIAQRLPRVARQNERAFLAGWHYGESLLKNA
jgi:Pyruvate/2-oxoacid:ferredoxin oxidoreductase gamma subunit